MYVDIDISLYIYIHTIVIYYSKSKACFSRLQPLCWWPHYRRLLPFPYSGDLNLPLYNDALLWTKVTTEMCRSPKRSPRMWKFNKSKKMCHAPCSCGSPQFLMVLLKKLRAYAFTLRKKRNTEGFRAQRSLVAQRRWWRQKRCRPWCVKPCDLRINESQGRTLVREWI